MSLLCEVQDKDLMHLNEKTVSNKNAYSKNALGILLELIKYKQLASNAFSYWFALKWVAIFVCWRVSMLENRLEQQNRPHFPKEPQSQ